MDSYPEMDKLWAETLTRILKRNKSLSRCVMRPKEKNLLSKQSHWGTQGWWLKQQVALIVGSTPLTATLGGLSGVRP